MPGTLTPLGVLSIGQAVPCLAQMVTGINGSLSFRLPSVQGQVAGLVRASASPPKLSVGAAAAVTAVTKLQAQVSAGLPGVGFNLGVITGAVAKLNASLGSLNAQLALAANLAGLLGSAGLQLYSYGGAVNGLGPALTVATSGGFPGGGGPSAACNALLIATQFSPTWTALQTVFATSSGAGLQYLGNESIGQCIPLALAASLALTATVGLVLPSISLQVAAFLQVSVQLAIKLPSLTANLQAAVLLAASLALSIGITIPTLTVQAALLISLQAELLSLSGQLTFALGISALLGLGGVSVYSYAGTVAGLGPAIATGLQGGLASGGSPVGSCNAIVLATELGATWTALSGVLKTS